LALIARGTVRPSTFTIAIDGRPTAASGPEARWLAEVAPRVQAVLPQARIRSDATSEVLTNIDGVTGYASWGSNDSRTRVPPVTFGPGALASSFMSSDARTMAAPPADWQPALWSEEKAYFFGSPEALAADWLAAGLTGLAAQVAEPYLDGAVRPATLHEAWARGYTLAESFYLAMPYLSWQTVVFGDPLARAVEASPEGHEALTDAGVGQGAFVDRMAIAFRVGQPDLDQEAARLMARATLSIARGEAADARRLLEQVTVRAPGYTHAHVLLGQQYDAEKLYDLARARYELVLRSEPANVVALNNLAYNLGVHGGDAKAGLAHAERAAALGGNSAAVLDTLGWLRHLSGDSRGGLGPLQRAVELDPSLCDAWTHLALAQRHAGDEASAMKAEERAASCSVDVRERR
jgi:Tfp pilus assembly protein PilF